MASLDRCPDRQSVSRHSGLSFDGAIVDQSESYRAVVSTC
jgi:hypothetical protein